MNQLHPMKEWWSRCLRLSNARTQYLSHKTARPKSLQYNSGFLLRNKREWMSKQRFIMICSSTTPPWDGKTHNCRIFKQSQYIIKKNNITKPNKKHDWTILKVISKCDLSLNLLKLKLRQQSKLKTLNIPVPFINKNNGIPWISLLGRCGRKKTQLSSSTIASDPWAWTWYFQNI